MAMILQIEFMNKFGEKEQDDIKFLHFTIDSIRSYEYAYEVIAYNGNTHPYPGIRLTQDERQIIAYMYIHELSEYKTSEKIFRFITIKE